MEYSAEDRCRIWLSGVDGIGPARFYRLIAEFGSAQAVWDNLSDMSEAQIRRVTQKAYAAMKAAKAGASVDALLDRMEKLGIRAVTTESENYPQPLLDICDAPPVLYCMGAAPMNYDRRFCVVGSRRATYDGRRAAREISELLSKNGVCIVSGMALGVDAEAHAGALRGDTHTVAVLGSGPDVVYPPENRALYDRILESGGLILSEYGPGTPPARYHFPQRNRILSGMSRGVLLVEGEKNSGAMITADFALDQGRDVFAVPGGIYAPMAAAPNQLIADGATPVLDAYTILGYYGWAEARPAGASRLEIQLDEDERRVLMELRYEALSFDELLMATMMPADELNTLLTMLELRQLVRRLPGNRFQVNL